MVLYKVVCNFTFLSTEKVWRCALLRCLLSRARTREWNFPLQVKKPCLFLWKKKQQAKGLRLKTQRPFDRLVTRVTNEKPANEDTCETQSVMQKQHGGLEMNPITTYCSRGDSHPAAATPPVFAWWITSRKCNRKRKARYAYWPTSNQSKTAAFVLPQNAWCKITAKFSLSHFEWAKWKEKWTVICLSVVFVYFCVFSPFLNCNRETTTCLIHLISPISKQKSIGCHRQLCKRRRLNTWPWIWMLNCKKYNQNLNKTQLLSITGVRHWYLHCNTALTQKK